MKANRFYLFLFIRKLQKKQLIKFLHRKRLHLKYY